MSYDRIRPDIRAALDSWGDGSRPHTGDFLRAVLSNDLSGAFGRADNDNRETLGEIASYVRNELPYDCHGSPEIVAAWAQKHRERIHAERDREAQEAADKAGAA